jgi:hypothetical protein
MGAESGNRYPGPAHFVFFVPFVVNQSDVATHIGGYVIS